MYSISNFVLKSLVFFFLSFSVPESSNTPFLVGVLFMLVVIIVLVTTLLLSCVRNKVQLHFFLFKHTCFSAVPTFPLTLVLIETSVPEPAADDSDGRPRGQ